MYFTAIKKNNKNMLFILKSYSIVFKHKFVEVEKDT